MWGPYIMWFLPHRFLTLASSYFGLHSLLLQKFVTFDSNSISRVSAMLRCIRNVKQDGTARHGTAPALVPWQEIGYIEPYETIYMWRHQHRLPSMALTIGSVPISKWCRGRHQRHRAPCCAVSSRVNVSCMLFKTEKQDRTETFFFWRTHVLFWGHWYPCFGFLVTSPLGFKARVGSALFAILWRQM